MSIQFACIHASIIYNVLPLDIESAIVVEGTVKVDEFTSVADVVDGTDDVSFVP